MHLILALMVVAMPAMAQPNPPSDAQLRQQERMRQCNADARQNNLTGEARQRFMSACLAGRPTGS